MLRFAKGFGIDAAPSAVSGMGVGCAGGVLVWLVILISKSGQVANSGGVKRRAIRKNNPSPAAGNRARPRQMDRYQRREDDEEDEALHESDGSHDDAESSTSAVGECAANDAAQNADEDEDVQAAAPALDSGKAEVPSPRVGRIGRFFKPRALPWERRLHRRSHLIVQRSISTATLSTRCLGTSVLVPRGTRKVTTFDAQSASHL